MYSGQGQSPTYQPPPRPRLDVITPAFQLFQKEMGTWVLATLIAGILPGILVTLYYVLIFAAALAGRDRGGEAAGILVQLMGYGIGMVVTILSGFFTTGMCHMALKQLRGQKIAVSDLFQPRAGIGAVIIAAILVGLGTSFGYYACLVPGLLLMGLWMLTEPILADQEVGGIDAMRMSFNLLRNDMWNALGVMFVLRMVAGIGAVLCGIGALFTYPILPISLALIYRDFFPDAEGGTQETSAYAPPPSVLGGDR